MSMDLCECVDIGQYKNHFYVKSLGYQKKEEKMEREREKRRWMKKEEEEEVEEDEENEEEDEEEGKLSQIKMR